MLTRKTPSTNLPLHGYHMTSIPKGVLGQASKIEEEMLEYLDACEQGCVLMALNELADLLGAMRAYSQRFNGMFIFDDLLKHSMVLEPVPWNFSSEEYAQTYLFHVRLIKGFEAQMPMISILRMINHQIKPYNLTLQDLDHMRALTENAFATGRRVAGK